MRTEKHREHGRGTPSANEGRPRRHPRRAPRTFIAGALLLLSGFLHASGGHAGGHGHGMEETAVGRPGQAAKVHRTIAITMGDGMRFTPSAIRVRQGETVRFLIRNPGQTRHEFSLGTQQELLEHLEAMKKYPEMEHDDPGKLTLEPGAHGTHGTIVWQFTQPGLVHFACLLPGHYEAGMRGQVTVGNP